MSESTLRVDKWLWHARFFKTRTLAAKLCSAGRLRVSGTVVSKAHHSVKVGDVLTFPQGRNIRVIRIVALSLRRGPAAEARLLYEDLKPPQVSIALPDELGAAARHQRGSGRPTKRDRRALERLRNGG